MAIAGLIALAAVRPWRSGVGDLKMAARQDASVPAGATAPLSRRDEPSPDTPRVSAEPAAAQPAPSRPTPDAAAPPGKPDVARAAPQFDIVRVEPSGEALLAGRGGPNSTVSLVDRGRVVGEAKTDSAGNFVMTPPALAPGDHALVLSEGRGAEAAESKQSVTVSVPKARSEQVVVAMAEPGRPTELLSPPPPSPAAPVPPKSSPPTARAAPKASSSPAAPPAAVPAASRMPAEVRLAIRSVEVENGSGFHATGVAPPGADIRLYLNDSRIADASASPAAAASPGGWSVTVRHGLSAGHYAVRADMVAPDGEVAARAEVPFDVSPSELPPAQVASVRHSSDAAPAVAEAPAASAGIETPSTKTETATAPIPTEGAADVVLDRLETELVTRGDNLWRISRHRLGQGVRFTQIYAANAAQIRNPRLIYPGQVFVLPRD